MDILVKIFYLRFAALLFQVWRERRTMDVVSKTNPVLSFLPPKFSAGAGYATYAIANTGLPVSRRSSLKEFGYQKSVENYALIAKLLWSFRVG